jgi:hypothetical protein
MDIDGRIHRKTERTSFKRKRGSETEPISMKKMLHETIEKDLAPVDKECVKEA